MDRFDQIEQEHVARQRARAAAHREQTAAGLQYVETTQPSAQEFYPLSLAQAPAPEPSLLSRQVGPLPVWGWGLCALTAAGVGGYFLLRKPEVEKNEAEPDLPRSPPPSNGERFTSRGRVMGVLRPFFQQKGLSSEVTIWDDADEAVASGKVAPVSPLITMKFKDPAKIPTRELDKLCKREGLMPITEGSVVGLYPGKGKRGREWEQYIDDLRDDGQQA